jgi:hypothetical protein
MTLVLLTWCPDPTKPAPCASMPCQPPQQPPEPPSGYPPWHSIAYDGTTDIQFYYQLQVPFVGTPILFGGHTITFGPHALPDPGAWFQPVSGPSGDVWTFYTVTTVFVGTGAGVVLPNASFAGPDSASVQAADLAAQWLAYNYAVANPP